MKPVVKRVYSENNDFQHVEVLKRNREKRNKFGEFFVEGVKSIDCALKYKWPVKTLIYNYERPLSQWARQVLQTAGAQLHLEMPVQLMEKLSDKEEDLSEILAVVAMPQNDLSCIPVKEDMLVVIFDRPSSHGNLGTLLRSCEALKVDGLIITGHAVDLYDPRTIRASMGTFFAVPTVRLDSQQGLQPWLQQVRDKFDGFRVVGSSSKGSGLIDETDLTGPMVLLLGNETSGLSHQYKELCDTLVRIPMYGGITSFNVSCAASILLYEIDRQRRGEKS